MEIERVPPPPPIPRLTRVGGFCDVERIYCSSIDGVFLLISVHGLVGLWVCVLCVWGCGFVYVVFAYVCVRLCVCVVYVFMCDCVFMNL